MYATSVTNEAGGNGTRCAHVCPSYRLFVRSECVVLPPENEEVTCCLPILTRDQEGGSSHCSLGRAVGHSLGLILFSFFRHPNGYEVPRVASYPVKYCDGISCERMSSCPILSHDVTSLKIQQLLVGQLKE